MTVTTASIAGSAILTQLLGQDLAAELLDPAKSADAKAAAGGSSQTSTQTTAKRAADTILLSPEAQALLQELQTTTLTNEGDVHGNILWGKDVTVGQPTPTYQPPDSTYHSVSADGFDAKGKAVTSGAGPLPDYGISDFTFHADSAGRVATTSNSLSISRDAAGTLSIYLNHSTTLASADGTTTGNGVSDQITIDPAGHVTFNQTDSASQTEANTGGETLAGQSVDLTLKDTATETVRTLTVEADRETIRGRDIDSRSSGQIQITEALTAGRSGTTQDDIALQLLKAGEQVSPGTGFTHGSNTEAHAPPISTGPSITIGSSTQAYSPLRLES